MDNAKRITTVSHKLRLICSALICCLPVLYALFWTFFNLLHTVTPMIPLPVRVDQDLPGLTRLLAFMADLIPLAATTYGVHRLRDLFLLYENELIFTERNVSCIRSLGKTLIVWVACDILRHSLLSIVLTMGNPPGKRLLVVGFSSGDLTGVFVGIVVLIVSWVMDEARKLKEDHSLIV